MSVSASLVSGQSKKVQIVVNGVPEGEPWELTGHVGDFTPGLTPGVGLLPGGSTVVADAAFVETGYSWSVNGGSGVGGGGQVALVDDRTPGNVPIAYRLTTAAGVEVTSPVTVPFARDIVLQTLDGQASVDVELMAGSLGLSFEPNVATFRVPGRSRPVVRYDVLGDVRSAFVVKVPMGETAALRRVLTSGAPIVYRFGAPEGSFDLDPVGAVLVSSVDSEPVPTADLRFWTLGYDLVDDPFADVRLGAFSWAAFDAAFAGRPWSDFDARFEGMSWAEFDTVDWSVV